MLLLFAQFGAQFWTVCLANILILSETRAGSSAVLWAARAVRLFVGSFLAVFHVYPVPPLTAKVADLHNPTALAMVVPVYFHIDAWSFAISCNYVPGFRVHGSTSGQRSKISLVSVNNEHYLLICAPPPAEPRPYSADLRFIVLACDRPR
ncbi:hypothetical protein C8J57DRAFT_1493496 [Mycena rebaudengoi]|nr:hypothetical protein C8J57DRAFT_1493496 [Mycena rebaudengoi]